MLFQHQPVDVVFNGDTIQVSEYLSRGGMSPVEVNSTKAILRLHNTFCFFGAYRIRIKFHPAGVRQAGDLPGGDGAGGIPVVGQPVGEADVAVGPEAVALLENQSVLRFSPLQQNAVLLHLLYGVRLPVEGGRRGPVPVGLGTGPRGTAVGEARAVAYGVEQLPVTVPDADQSATQGGVYRERQAIAGDGDGLILRGRTVFCGTAGEKLEEQQQQNIPKRSEVRRVHTEGFSQRER